MVEKEINPELSYFDQLDENVIRIICQQLIGQKDYKTLSYLIRTHKRIHTICQGVLHQQRKVKVYHYPTLSQAVLFDDLLHCELDLACGKYEKWLQRYPQSCVTFFAYLLIYSKHPISDSTIWMFMQCGLDLNVESNIYTTQDRTTTPLVMMCHLRDAPRIRSLCLLGADVNLMDTESTLPLEALMVGDLEGLRDDNKIGFNLIDLGLGSDSKIRRYDFLNLEKCLRILIEYHVENQLESWLLIKLMENLSLLEQFSPFTAQFLHATQIRQLDE